MVQLLKRSMTVFALVVVVVAATTAPAIAAATTPVTTREFIWIDTYVIVAVVSNIIVTATAAIVFLHRTILVIAVHLSWLIAVIWSSSVEINNYTIQIWIVCDGNDDDRRIHRLHRHTLSYAQKSNNRFFGAAIQPSEIHSTNGIHDVFGTWNRWHCRWTKRLPIEITMATICVYIVIMINEIVVIVIDHHIIGLLTCEIFHLRPAALVRMLLIMTQQQNKFGEFKI